MKDRIVEVKDRRNIKDCPTLFADVYLKLFQGGNSSIENISLSEKEALEVRNGLNKLLGDKK